MSKFSKFNFFLLTLILPFNIFAQNTSTGVVLPLDPAVRTGKLPNGFTYYIRHNEEPKSRVVLYLVNKAGSVLEDEDQRGLAHFMEHMSFNGTTHFPHNELVNYLQKAGVRFGADINAYTSFDETVYQLPLPTDKPGLVNTGIEIMRDWAHNATLDPVEIDKERGVVLEEKRLGKGASERMRQQYWPVLLNNSRYAVRIPIGLDTVLNNFKRPAIARFYHDWYRPDLQALIVVGDVNVNEIEQKIKKEFGDLKNPVNERKRTKYKVPLDGKNQFIAVTDKEMTVTVAEVLIQHPEIFLKTQNDYKKSIIQSLYNRMMAERFDELSIVAKPPFIQGNANIAGVTGDLSAFIALVVAKPGELESGFKAVWREVQRVNKFGFSQSELDRAKANLLVYSETQWKEKNKTNSQSFVSEYQEYFLNGTMAPGIEKEYEMTKTDLPQINLADVNALSTTYITPDNRTTLVLAPDKDKASLPNEAILNTWMKDVEAETLVPHKDDVSNKPFLTQEPIPGKIIAERKNEITGIYTYSLSNGVQVILKPTDFKNDEIIFKAVKPGGTTLASNTNYESAAFSANLINASGAGNYNETELGKYISGKQINVRPFVAARSEGFQGSSSSGDLQTALALTYAYITEPRKDGDAFDGIVTKSKAVLTNRSSDPKSVFSDSVNAIMYNYNNRYTGPSIEKINQLNLDSALAFYKQRFRNVNGMTFTFVGSIDTNAIKPLLEKYIASLPADNGVEEPKNLGIHIREGIVTKNVYKGSEPQSTVMLIFSGTMNYSQQNGIKLDALKETLEIRLLERLREEESGVYSPGVYTSTNKYPEGRYSFIIEFGCAPQNVDKLVASTLDEINKLKQSGPPELNLEKWRAEGQNSREAALKTNRFWLQYISNQIENNQPIDELESYEAEKSAINVSNLQEAAKTYLSGDNFIRFVLKPVNPLDKTSN
ncbi:MAG: insulinase family protein [Bacteroidota bacterium]|nr:insulinase family protein [Bacteroidota bacterium]